MFRVNATDIVVNSVKEALQTGKLHVGDRLPKEADMAKELGVGRSSLREGMKILAAYGVIESRQGEGTFVVDHCAQNFSEFLGFFPSQENRMPFLELRRVIEVGNILTIYDKVTEEDFIVLDKLVTVFDEKHPERDYVEADKQFHAYLLELTKNPMLTQISKLLENMRTELLWKLFEYKEIIEDARIAHHRILDALKSRDRVACAEAVLQHLDTTAKRVILISHGKE